MIFKLATKYLFSKKLPTGIHLISATAIISIALGTGILLIVLSVFNGLENLLGNIFGKIDPEYKIVYKEGKYIPTEAINKLQAKNIYPVLRNKAILRNKNAQRIVEVVGIPKQVLKHFNEDIILNGKLHIAGTKYYAYAIIGSGVAYDLQINPMLNDSLTILAIDEKKELHNNYEEAVNIAMILPMGIFSVQNKYDNNVVFVTKKFAENIFNQKDKVTELFVYNIPLDSLLKIFPENKYDILDRNTQHSDLYKVLRNEKLIAFLLLSFVLLLISFNIFTTIGIISIAKRRDITILYVLGTSIKNTRKIFTTIGVLMSFISLSLGIPLGLLFIALQKKYGIITLGNTSSFIVKTMPMDIKIPDVFMIIMVVIFISFVSSYIPAKNISVNTREIR